MTLVDTSLYMKAVSMPGIMQWGIHAKYLLLGDWFDTPAALVFDAFRFTCEDLNYWLDISGFEKPVYDQEHHIVNITYTRPNTRVFSINADFELYIEFDYYGPSEYHAPSDQMTIEQRPYFKIVSKKGKRPLEDFLEYYHSFLSFLSFCYFGYPVTTECVFQRNDVNGENRSLRDIEVFYQAGMNYEKYKSHHDSSDFLIRFTDIQDIFSTVLSNWFLVKTKIKAGINMLAELFMYRNSLLELRFLSMVQAAEHMHRQLINDQKMYLQQRLEELIARLPIDVKDALLSDPAKFTTAIKVNRNYFTHYDEKQANNAARLNEVHLLAEKMKIILLTIVFQELRVPNSQISDIVLKNGIWLFNHLIKIKPDEFSGKD